jgi:hypothetical protein
MANQASWNPLYIDTVPFVWQPNSQGNPNVCPLKIESIVWSGQAAAGDVVTVLDAYGHEIWNAEAYNTDFQQESSKIGWVNGLQVTRLDSGHLQFYLSFKA